MTTAITAPQIAVKHPDEEVWYEFSFARIFKFEDEEIWTNGEIEITCDPLGLTFNAAEAIIEDKSLFIKVSGGVSLTDPNTGRLLPYNLSCGIDSTRDGFTKFSRRVQIGRIKVSST